MKHLFRDKNGMRFQASLNEVREILADESGLNVYFKRAVVPLILENCTIEQVKEEAPNFVELHTIDAYEENPGTILINADMVDFDRPLEVIKSNEFYPSMSPISFKNSWPFQTLVTETAEEVEQKFGRKFPALEAA